MTGPALSRDDADRMLTGLGAAHDRVAAAMYALDTHPALTVLRGGMLAGATAGRWRTLKPEIDVLWAHFTLLGQLVDEARTLRGQRRPNDVDWVRLTYLLREPLAELAADGMPVSTPGTAATRMPVGELATRVEQLCAGVTAQLSEVDASFSAVAARVTTVTTTVDSVVALATELAEPTAGTRLRAALDAAQQADLGDPLTAAPGGRLSPASESRWAGLATEAAATRRLLEELATVRGSYPQLRASLSSLVDDLAAGERAAADAQVRVAEKIADPGLSAPPAATATLKGRLDDLDRLYEQARGDGKLWRRLADELATVEQAATRARERAAELRGVAEGLIARRDELRGRLLGYRAKAAARGLAEDPELTTLHTRARTLLYTAPCDLRASTRAVYAYQQALSDRLASAGTLPTRSDVDD